MLSYSYANKILDPIQAWRFAIPFNLKIRRFRVNKSREKKSFHHNYCGKENRTSFSRLVAGLVVNRQTGSEW